MENHEEPTTIPTEGSEGTFSEESTGNSGTGGENVSETPEASNEGTQVTEVIDNPVVEETAPTVENNTTESQTETPSTEAPTVVVVKPEPKKDNTWIWLLIGMLIIVICAYLYSIYGTTKEDTAEQ